MAQAGRMQPDASFAEFVSVRWSVLYRLAVLLAGPDEADDLLEGALAGALHSWGELRHAGSAEEHVKERLAHDAAVLAPGAEHRAGHDDLRARIDALPPRQRVVLVLQCYELLATGDIARALGCRADVVEAESAAAFDRLGATSAEVTGELERAANDVPVPLPPIDAVLARARDVRRRNTRRVVRWSALAVAVLLVGSGVATVVQQRDDGRTSAATEHSRPRIARLLDDLPLGRAPLTAYAEQRNLHVDGRSTVLPDTPTAVARGPQKWYVSFASGTIVAVQVDPPQVTLVTDAAAGTAVTDVLGRYVAWVEGPQASPQVVVQSTEEDVPGLITRREKPLADCCADQLRIDGLTPSGSVIASVPSELRAWLWRAAGDYGRDPPQEIEGIGNGVVRQVTAGELVVQYPPFQFAVGRLDDLAFLAEEDLRASNADFSDPRGERIVYADADGEIHVGRRKVGFGRDRAHDLRLRLPRLATGFTDLVWEDSSNVLLDVADTSLPQGALVRCTVATGACELAVRFEAPHVLAH